MQIRDLGLIEYGASLPIQDQAVSKVIAEGAEGETLFICEHFPVITVGRALGSNQEVFTKDIPVFEVPRGGRATLHLPGQVVVYPILDLKARGRNLHAYMRCLENAVIDTLADFRVVAQSVEGKTGVWIEESRKIASVGIAAKSWVSYHGLALNVACDLSLFSKINPCGFNSNVMTSLIREMGDGYKKVWAIESGGLTKRVKKRLVENLLERLEQGWSASQTEKAAN